MLVFASAPVEPRVEEPARDRIVLVFPHAVLDASAARKLEPARGGAVTAVNAAEVRGDTVSVRVVIRRRAGAEFGFEVRGGTSAVSFIDPVATPRSARFALNQKNVDIVDVLKQVAKLTGERFVYDDQLRGRVSVLIRRPLEPAEARVLLDALLAMRGFGAVETASGVTSILPVAQLDGQIPWREGVPSSEREAPVATLVHLDTADVGEVVSLLAPWLGDDVTALPHAPTNGIILVGRERLLHGVLLLARSLDAAAEQGVMVRRLRYLVAEEAATRLAQILDDGRGRVSDRVRIVPDARANLLVVTGRGERLSEVRELIDRLDRAPETTGEIHVRRILYADPEELLQTLEAAVKSGGGTGANGVGGPAIDYSAAVDPPTRSLVVRAAPDSWRVVAGLIDELDRLPPRVSVEATIFELMTSERLSIAFDAALLTGIGGFALNPSGGGLLDPASGTGPALGARYSSGTLTIPLLDADGNATLLTLPRRSFVITAEESVVAGRVIQRPHLLVIAGEEHQLFAGDEVPIPVSGAGATETAAGEGVEIGTGVLQTRVDVQRTDVGVRLRVRPTLGRESRTIRLELELEQSRVSASALVGASGEEGPVINNRQLTTTVVLRDGHAVLLGGLQGEQLQASEVGTPWLREVPGLGALFRANRDQKLENRLMLAVQARIHREGSSEIAHSIRRRLGMERVLARVEGLTRKQDPSWGVRAATRLLRGDAEDIALHFAGAGAETRVVAWEIDGEPRFDVVLVGYASFEDAADAVELVLAKGFEPELVPIPARGAE